MSEAAVSAPGTTGGSSNAAPTGQAGATKGLWMALAVAVVAAGAGWSQYYTTNRHLAATAGDLTAARSDIDALKATFAAAGLDAASPQSLGLSIAEQRRTLTDLENALVAKSAAARARDAQIARAASTLTTLEAASASASSAESEASRLFADLDARNRALTPRVAELESAAVSWGAAAGARRTELDRLLAEVETNKALIADAALWRERGAALTAQQATLAREVTDLQNTVVSLAAAVGYRQGELSKAVVAASQAEADQRQATVTTLEMRAEATRLEKTIAALAADRARVNQALTDVNNRFVPALAAVAVRERQVSEMGALVAARQAEADRLAAASADLTARLTAGEDRLAEVTSVADQAAEHLRAIDAILGAPTVQAALAAR